MHPPHVSYYRALHRQTLHHTLSTMKKAIITILSSAVLGALQLTAHDNAPQKLPDGRVLVWHDEFNGKKLNPKKWKHELGVIRNYGAAQTYTKEAVRLSNGKLIITTKAKETPNANFSPGSTDWRKQRKSMPYSSGSVTTQGIKNFYHGRLEVRAKVPGNKGAWPAIWLICDNGWGWPACGEIDVMEHASQHKDCCYATFHWGRNGGTHNDYDSKMPHRPGMTNGFHVYSMEWTDKEIILEMDGVVTNRFDISRTEYPNGKNPFRTPAYLIINTAVGGPGTMTEAPDASQYPCTFEIDYVRFYAHPNNKKPGKK